MNVTIWQTIEDEAPVAIAAAQPMWLTPDGVHAAGDADRPLMHDDGALLIAAPAGGNSSAALLVPPRLAIEVCLNGVPLAAGLHAALHGDQIRVAETEFWVARSAAPSEVTYDPATMGDDVFCARTKARIKPGERVVICPGTAKHACGMIYRVEAWAIGVVCHVCRFDPNAPSWQPPAKTTESQLDELFRFAACER